MERAAGERAAGDLIAGERIEGERADGGRADGERTAGERAAGERAAAGVTEADTSTFSRLPREVGTGEETFPASTARFEDDGRCTVRERTPLTERSRREVSSSSWIAPTEGDWPTRARDGRVADAFPIRRRPLDVDIVIVPFP